MNPRGTTFPSAAQFREKKLTRFLEFALATKIVDESSLFTINEREKKIALIAFK